MLQQIIKYTFVKAIQEINQIDLKECSVKMTLQFKPNKETFPENTAYLEEIESKTPEEAHTLIVNVLYDHKN